MLTIYAELVITIAILFVSLGSGLLTFEVTLSIFIERIKSVCVGDAMLI